MSKNNINIVIAAVVVVLVVGFAVWSNKQGMKNPYSVVYLATGEVYVGKLSTFPDFQLKSAYILQVTKDEKDASKSNFQLVPISEALWATDSMHLNRKNVVFYGAILPNSRIGQALAGKK